MTGELYGDVPHDLFLVSIFSKKIAEQVDDFICRLLCSSSTIFLFRDIFQNPERCTGLFRTLLGHIFSGFGFVDRLVVLQMENLLHIGLKFLPYLGARRKIVIDDFLFAEAGNHSCEGLLGQRPWIIVALIPAEFAVGIVPQQKAKDISTRHAVIIAKRSFL